jgi:hypothetical protein
MFDKLSEGSSGGAAIYLDYGADASECDEADFRVCDRGMCFKSRWQFEPGTQLAVVLSCTGDGGECNRMDAEATVAACEPAGVGCYRVTALFVDLPDDQRAEMRTLGARMSRDFAIKAAVRA